MADDLTDQGIDELMLHRTGQCGIDWCVYCLEEWETDRIGEK